MVLLRRLQLQRLCEQNLKVAKKLSRQCILRSIHTVPKLENYESWKEYGIPGLYSVEGFKIAWADYQAYVCKKLTEVTAGGPDENDTPLAVLLASARNPSQGQKFNYASMAWNNHFFFNGISNKPESDSVTLSNFLVRSLEQDFSSIKNLRDVFLTNADVMFGPGFVWLVGMINANGEYSHRILRTYAAGSPISGAHNRLQPLDMNTENVASTSQWYKERGSHRSMHGGIDIEPLLCVNTWEHAWLHDWGFDGKMDYLRAWWDRINWAKVEEKISRVDKYIDN